MDTVVHAPSDNILILKELSDIKEKLATNTAETSGVKTTVTDIRTDLRTIQQSFVTHIEFGAQQKEAEKLAADHEKRIRTLESNVWKAIGALAVLQFVIPIIAKFFFS